MSGALEGATRGGAAEGEPLELATTTTEWMRVLARTLVDAGIARVIASPGSRSTPILAALLGAGLEVTDVIDERSAAFVALGHARASGAPVAALATSGTAPAHWYPAVIEASLACLPLVLVSANRPRELQHAGAPQTIDQDRLFGSHARFFVDVGAPSASEAALAGLRRLVGQAVAIARGPHPGPVHLDVPARKPLEPRAPQRPPERALHALADAVLARPLTRSAPCIQADTAELDALAERLRLVSRLLFVAGPLPSSLDVAAVLGLVARAGGTLSAEATSQLRFAQPRDGGIDALDPWLEAGLFDGSLAPELVIELGGAPTSNAYERWVARAKPRRVVLGAHAHVDPHASADAILFGELGALARALEPRLDPSLAVCMTATAYRARLSALDAAAEALVEERAARWGEPSIARALVRAIPEGGRLVVGNSLPIRVLDRYASRALRASPLEVLHQRGANGIDGFLAQAAGASLAAPKPSALLVGDVTFLHDVGSLVHARHVRAPLVVVVVDNAGGRIFEALPIAREAAWMMPHVRTHEPIDHEALARAFGVAFARVEDETGLARALEAGLARPGLTLVHARVEPLGLHAFEAELHGALRARLARPSEVA